MGIVRKTKSVKALLNVFEQSDEAIAVAALIEQLRDKMNKTTVYRILDRLEDDGVLHSFIDGDGFKWYSKTPKDSATSHNHPHFQCSECGKVECVMVDIIIPKLANHRVDAVNLLLIGQCADCSS